MLQEKRQILEETRQRRFEHVADRDALLFTWKHVKGLSASDFRQGIEDFAVLCRDKRPRLAVIDAAQLDQQSPAVAWLQNRQGGGGSQTYTDWWMRAVVPIYHAAGIAGLSVGTGDPNAPGELPPMPGVGFKVAYFPDVETAMDWKA